MTRPDTPNGRERIVCGLEAFAAHVFDLASGEVTMTMQHGRIEVGA